MIKQIRKVFAILLIASCVVTIIPNTVKAEEITEDNDLQPCLTILDTVSLYLEDSNGKAVVSGFVTADTDATKVSLSYTLQKYSNGKWSTVNNEIKSSNSDFLNFSMSYTVGSGKYRVIGTAHAYIGTKHESLSVTGNTVTF